MNGWGRRVPDRHARTASVLPCPAAAAITDLRFENVRERPARARFGATPRRSTRYRGTAAGCREPCRSCERRELDWGGCRCQAFLLDRRCRRDRSGVFAQPGSPHHRCACARAMPKLEPVRSAHVIVRVLGSAAGGGVPQWNCACANCKAAREGRAPRRTQSSLAVSPSGDALGFCSTARLTSPRKSNPFHRCSRAAGRGTPIDGILLTDANVDHIGGLPVLRQSSRRTRVRSSAAVRAIAATQPSFAQFDAPPHRWLEVPLGERLPE